VFGFLHFIAALIFNITWIFQRFYEILGRRQNLSKILTILIKIFRSIKNIRLLTESQSKLLTLRSACIGLHQTIRFLVKIFDRFNSVKIFHQNKLAIL